MQKRNNYFQKNYKIYLLLLMHNVFWVSSGEYWAETHSNRNKGRPRMQRKRNYKGNQRTETRVMVDRLDRKSSALIPAHTYQPIHGRSRITAEGNLRMLVSSRDPV
jgi:hypothetical protein